VTFARVASVTGPGLAAILALFALPACTSSVDSLGYDDEAAVGGGGGGGGEPGLRPLVRPGSYPNPFRDDLGKIQTDIDTKIDSAFDQLFHGGPDETVYFPVGTDQALIRDILHMDERTEGIGFGMLISVELNRKDEFDRLWRYAKAAMRSAAPNDGYYDSRCDNVDGISSVDCIDPFGMEQFAMALIFAHGRWGSDGSIDYETDVLELLDVMRNKEQRNGGIVDGVTNVFDANTKLPFHVPNVSAATFTRPSLVIPAYYELWGQATGDAFWAQAAEAGRAYTRAVAHPTTGLVPVRAYLTGEPVTGSGWDTFRHEAYRTELNLALDWIWTAKDPWVVEEADRLIGFFAGQGDPYGKAYALDGAVLEAMPESALVAANGAAAAIATRMERRAFIQAVWDMPVPSGGARYYSGMMHLLSLLVLGGRFQVY
jgi:oligosaccharide reducing-end xylanase